MSNDPKPSTTPAPQPPKQDGPTRIPVKHLWAMTDCQFDWPSLGRTESNIPCGPLANGRQHYTCNFIPAWDSMEITLHPNGGGATSAFYLPMHHVKRWERE